jgi:recombination protein RecA
MDTIRAFVETNAIDLIIVDSVAALVPRSELEGEEMLKDTMATQARLLGKALRILTGPISRSKTIVIFINQLRDKIGVFYGQKETTPGGKALKFFSSVRLSVTKGDKILGTKEEQIGNRLNITAVKNKVGFPWRRCSIDLYYGTGIDLISDLFDTAVESNVIKKEGNTYSYDKIELGVGREKALDNLRKSPAETIKIIREATSKDVKEEK